MRILFVYAVLVIGILACSNARKAVQIAGKDTVHAENDSLEYELETFDPKFESWYAMHDQPSQYRSESYYENWNQQYVNAWNYRAIQPGNRFFEPISGYDPTTDYNFELDHKLFYYFQYVENVLRIRIMNGGPRGIVF